MSFFFSTELKIFLATKIWLSASTILSISNTTFISPVQNHLWQIREQNLIVRFRSVHEHGRNRCDCYTLITKVKSKSYRSHWQKIFTSFYQYNKQMLQTFRLHFCLALMRMFSKNKNEKNCSANCTIVIVIR